MMNEEMMKHMTSMLGKAGAIVASPVSKPSLPVAGVLLLRHPVLLLGAGLAAGVAAGFLLHKYQKEIVAGLGQASGMGRDFVLHQKENLTDLMAEAEDRALYPASPAPDYPSAAASSSAHGEAV